MSRPTNRRYCEECGRWIFTFRPVTGGVLPTSEIVFRPGCTKVRTRGHVGYVCDEHQDEPELRETDAYLDDPEGARKLWAGGFRPQDVNELRVGQTVAFVETFAGGRMGDVQASRVRAIHTPKAGGPAYFEEYEVVLDDPQDRTVEASGCDVVWARPQERSQP